MKKFLLTTLPLLAFLTCFCISQSNAQSNAGGAKDKPDLSYKGNDSNLDSFGLGSGNSGNNGNSGGRGVHSHGGGWGCIDIGKSVEVCGYRGGGGTIGVGIGGHFGGGGKSSGGKSGGRDPGDKW